MVTKNTDAQVRNVFEKWHEATMKQDIKAIAALYAVDAVFESPAVWVLNRQSDGILRGRDAIATYFGTFMSKSGAGAAEWFRDGRYFSDGELLMWEYPRVTPNGEQNDIVESIDLRDGLIAAHRVYWGWAGLKNLIAKMENVATK